MDNDRIFNIHNRRFNNNIMSTPIDPDPIVETVLQRMITRSAEGIKKYGCTMMRTDVSTVEWIDHAIEEALDHAVYLERLKYDLILLNEIITGEKDDKSVD